MAEAAKVVKKQFNGVVYSKFSDVPSELIVSTFVGDKVIEGIVSKCQWYTERLTQEEVTAKMTLLINLLSLRERLDVLDFGGGIGQFLFSVEKYLMSDNAVTWNVFDTEEMIAVAGKKAKTKDNVFFYSRLEEIQKADLVFLRQSLQVLEDPRKTLKEIVGRFHPKAIFLCGVPAGLNEDYLSLVLAYGEEHKGCPCWIFNEKKLVDFVTGLGYVLTDQFMENITVDLSDFPARYHLDREGKNHVRGYVFLREGMSIRI